MLFPIENRIFQIRGQNVTPDSDLAALYGVPTKVLKQAVKRNIERFPPDFMFELGLDELKYLRSQFVTSNETGGRGGERYLPYAFTEQGVAMLSSVLRSSRAIQVNIQIMRTFVNLRQLAATHDDLRVKLETLEQRYDKQFKIVFDAMRRLLAEDEEPKAEIGFKAD